MIALTARAQGTILAVRAQPGARKNAVVGEHAGAVRVAVSAAPERGKANAAIQDVLARALGVKASQIALISGEMQLPSADESVLVCHPNENVSEWIEQNLRPLMTKEST